VAVVAAECVDEAGVCGYVHVASLSVHGRDLCPLVRVQVESAAIVEIVRAILEEN
jgi:hypothetical protein